MSGEFEVRLRAACPDVDWDAAFAAARERQERARRSLYWRARHWVHARLHPQLHEQRCSLCREAA